jgi:type IV secretory pathway TraG/TraD family ATPase VirD4
MIYEPRYLGTSPSEFLPPIHLTLQDCSRLRALLRADGVQVSVQDIFTSEYLSKLCGETIRDRHGHSSSRKPGKWFAEKSRSGSETPTPIMLPQDFRNMDMGFSVVLSRKSEPVCSFCADPSELPEFAPLARRSPS